MTTQLKEDIAGFDYCLIEGVLRNKLKYRRKMADVKTEDEDMSVRLYDDNGLEASVVKKDYFPFKHIIRDNYINRAGREVIEASDINKQLYLVGYKIEARHG